MNGVIYGVVRAHRDAVSNGAKTENSKRFFALFVNALMESRRQQAARVIADHVHLLANDPNLPVRRMTRYGGNDEANRMD